MSTFWQKKIFGIRLWEWGLLCLFYAFFAIAYSLALLFSSSQEQDQFPEILMDYGLKAVYTLPIWWLIFRKLGHWNIWKQVILHIFFLPIYVVVWQQTYYFICDIIGWGHLDWPFAFWDIYIPGLFYVLQFGVFHVYAFYAKLQEQQKLESELRQVALKSELTALKAQLNPHFLYNTFNTINASVPAQLENTREMVAKLSDMFRYQLQSSKSDLVPLSDEVEFTRNYLELEKARFGSRLNFNICLDTDLEHALVPPMILQPLVENAVKHGVSPQIEGGEVAVEIKNVRNEVSISVYDNGVGVKEQITSENGGVGLANTKKRLALRFQRGMNIENNPGGGIKIFFSLPLIIPEKEAVV